MHTKYIYKRYNKLFDTSLEDESMKYSLKYIRGYKKLWTRDNIKSIFYF